MSALPVLVSGCQTQTNATVEKYSRKRWRKLCGIVYPLKSFVQQTASRMCWPRVDCSELKSSCAVVQRQAVTVQQEHVRCSLVAEQSQVMISIGPVELSRMLLITSMYGFDPNLLLQSAHTFLVSWLDRMRCKMTSRCDVHSKACFRGQHTLILIADAFLTYAVFCTRNTVYDHPWVNLRVQTICSLYEIDLKQLQTEQDIYTARYSLRWNVSDSMHSVRHVQVDASWLTLHNLLQVMYSSHSHRFANMRRLLADECMRQISSVAKAWLYMWLPEIVADGRHRPRIRIRW
jgi:hypothetical protein